MSGADDIRNVRDRLDILELFARYCYAVDDRDPEGVADCFTEDGVFASSLTGVDRGREAIAKNFRGKKKGESQRHTFFNPIITFDGDKAAFRAYMQVTWLRGDRYEIRVTGRYHGILVRQNGRWLFAERHVVADGPDPAREALASP